MYWHQTLYRDSVWFPEEVQKKMWVIGPLGGTAMSKSTEYVQKAWVMFRPSLTKVIRWIFDFQKHLFVTDNWNKHQSWQTGSDLIFSNTSMYWHQTWYIDLVPLPEDVQMLVFCSFVTRLLCALPYFPALFLPVCLVWPVFCTCYFWFTLMFDFDLLCLDFLWIFGFWFWILILFVCWIGLPLYFRPSACDYHYLDYLCCNCSMELRLYIWLCTTLPALLWTVPIWTLPVFTPTGFF